VLSLTYNDHITTATARYPQTTLEAPTVIHTHDLHATYF